MCFTATWKVISMSIGLEGLETDSQNFVLKKLCWKDRVSSLKQNLLVNSTGLLTKCLLTFCKDKR